MIYMVELITFIIIDEPKVPIKIEDDEIKIEKVVRSAQEVKQLTNKRTERRNDDDDDEDDELEKKPSKKPMGKLCFNLYHFKYF